MLATVLEETMNLTIIREWVLREIREGTEAQRSAMIKELGSILIDADCIHQSLPNDLTTASLRFHESRTAPWCKNKDSDTSAFIFKGVLSATPSDVPSATPSEVPSANPSEVPSANLSEVPLISYSYKNNHFIDRVAKGFFGKMLNAMLESEHSIDPNLRSKKGKTTSDAFIFIQKQNKLLRVECNTSRPQKSEYSYSIQCDPPLNKNDAYFCVLFKRGSRDSYDNITQIWGDVYKVVFVAVDDIPQERYKSENFSVNLVNGRKSTVIKCTAVYTRPKGDLGGFHGAKFETFAESVENWARSWEKKEYSPQEPAPRQSSRLRKNQMPSK